jgi:glycerophosphoryl diester phosphodiesterase
LKRTLAIAHTGCMNTPDNSIQSVLEGIKAGADVLEVDVRATLDGIAVLFHDEAIGTPNGSKKIRDLTFEELERAADRKSIVKLEEVLPVIRENGRSIMLDLKEDYAVEPMIKVIEKHSMRDYSIIGGCKKETAAYIKEHFRPYQVLLNASGSLFEECRDDYETFYKKTCEDAIAASCCGINLNDRHCSEALMDYTKLRCLPVFVWTIDETSRLEKFLNMGVHSITTNEIQTLVELRNKSN